MRQANRLRREIDRFLATGQHDLLFRSWPGAHILEKCQRGGASMLDALVEEVRRREEKATSTIVRGSIVCPPEGQDLIAFTRAKVGPMVRGLFPRKEQGPVEELLERSVVFLTPDRIEAILRDERSLNTAWRLANMYLHSVRAEPLAEEEPFAVGCSEETTCYVTLTYFSEECPFADYVVHEAAHVFHNTKRETVGLPHTRTKEWLLPIDFGKRETFAYACEAFSRISEMSRRPVDRRALLARLADEPPPPDDHVDPKEFLGILGEAVERRNGWRAILERCSRQPRARSVGSRQPLEPRPLEKEEVELDIQWATGRRFEGG
jgi:hypothetical protein